MDTKQVADRVLVAAEAIALEVGDFQSWEEVDSVNDRRKYVNAAVVAMSLSSFVPLEVLERIKPVI